MLTKGLDTADAPPFLSQFRKILYSLGAKMSIFAPSPEKIPFRRTERVFESSQLTATAGAEHVLLRQLHAALRAQTLPGRRDGFRGRLLRLLPAAAQNDDNYHQRHAQYLQNGLEGVDAVVGGGGTRCIVGHRAVPRELIVHFHILHTGKARQDIAEGLPESTFAHRNPAILALDAGPEVGRGKFLDILPEPGREAQNIASDAVFIVDFQGRTLDHPLPQVGF